MVFLLHNLRDRAKRFPQTFDELLVPLFLPLLQGFYFIVGFAHNITEILHMGVFALLLLFYIEFDQLEIFLS